jgi:uncharacterized membrane protein
LEKQYLLNVDDSVYVTKDENGKLQIHQSQDLTAAGAAGGAFWGLLFGLLFFVPVAGMAVGAGLGAITGHFAEYGIDTDFVKSLTGAMGPNTSALFLLVRDVNQEKVLEQIAPYGGTILRTSLSTEAEQKLQAALSAGSAAPATGAAASPAGGGA